MGIDIRMSVGVGVHIPQDRYEFWVDANDIEDPYDEFDALVRGYQGLSFDWVGNAWLGQEYGVVVWVARVTHSFKMGREAEAGVYEPSGNAITLEERTNLQNFARDFGLDDAKIKPYVTVTVS